MKTSVIFRTDENGDCLAVFPYEIADRQGNCTCYAHTGQHSACSYDYVLKETKPCKNYSDLKSELERIGYNLEVITRRDYDEYLKAFYLILNK